METVIENRESGVTAEGVPYDSFTIRPKTEEEIRIEKVLDDMELRRLEEDRQVLDMEGWNDSNAGQGNAWRPKRVDRKV
jgi:hypothetical protein